MAKDPQIYEPITERQLETLLAMMNTGRASADIAAGMVEELTGGLTFLALLFPLHFIALTGIGEERAD